MRLSYLDILEQCFHDKFRGYNKQEVDTFLRLIADDFKSMVEEIKDKEDLITTKDYEIKKLHSALKSRPAEIDTGIAVKIEKELIRLRKQIVEKDLLIKNMQIAQGQHEDKDKLFSKITPEILKKKAKKIVNAAKNQAEEHRKESMKELEQLIQDIEELKKQKSILMKNIKSTATEHLNKIKAGLPNSRT